MATATPYAIHIAAVEPTRPEDKSSADKRETEGTHVSGLQHAEDRAEPWSAPLLGCFSSCVPNCCVVSLCPCISLAQIDARLGGSFEMAVMGFGVLVTALLLCAGLLVSSAQTSHYSATESTIEYTSSRPPKQSVPIPFIVAAAAAVLLALTLATARLRYKTRKQASLAGSAAQDLALSLACCPCVVAQMATQLATYSPGVCSLAPPLDERDERDVLPAFMVTPLA